MVHSSPRKTNENPISKQPFLIVLSVLLLMTVRLSESVQFCHVCQQNIKKPPYECTRTVKADCTRMLRRTDPNDIYCLSRLTVHEESGVGFLEKTCTTKKTLSVQSHPESIVLGNCGAYQDDTVKYCTCKKDYCNLGTLEEMDFSNSASSLTSAYSHQHRYFLASSTFITIITPSVLMILFRYISLPHPILSN